MKTILNLILFASLFLSNPSGAQAPEQTVNIPKDIAAEIKCMEKNLHHEARGESVEGIKAVANVTINRSKSGKFPNSICKVIKQPFQFSWVGTELDKPIKVAAHIRQIAYDALLSNEWQDNTNKALYFHNKTVDGFNKIKTATIGNHVFYR